jgi:hypothetical protein
MRSAARLGEPDLQGKRRHRTRRGMKSNKTRRSVDRLADRATDAYVNWREECVAVQDAYEAWTHAGAERPPFAFEAYRRALDREERAANAYAELVTYVGAAPAFSPAQGFADLSAGRSR